MTLKTKNPAIIGLLAVFTLIFMFFAYAQSAQASTCYGPGDAYFNPNVNCYNPAPAPTPIVYQCSDGRDNDGDGYFDYPEDPSCFSRTDNNEWPYDNNDNDLDVSCDVSDTRVEVGDRVYFEADVSGGYPPYYYEWDGEISGDDEEENTRFYDEGTYEVGVEVRDRRGNRVNGDCHSVLVEDLNNYQNYFPVPTPAPQPQVVQAPVSRTIVAQQAQTQVSANQFGQFDIRMWTDEENTVYISWQTSQPSRGIVHYGLQSQLDQQSFHYEYQTSETAGLSTLHQVKISNLQIERTYYFRVVSTFGDQRIVSAERSFTLHRGGSADYTGFASAFGSLSYLLFNSYTLLFIMIILLAILIFFQGRRGRKKIVVK